MNTLAPIEQKTGGLPQKADLCTAIEAATETGEVMPVHDVAKALKAAAKSAGNRQAMADAHEVVRRAERKLGQLMAEQKLTIGVNKGGAEKGVGRRGKKNAGFENPTFPPTYAEAGIDKNLAYRAREAAEGSDEGFEIDLQEQIGRILNPPPTSEQRSDEYAEREAYARSPEGKAERRRKKEERKRLIREDEERRRREHPEWFADDDEPAPIKDEPAATEDAPIEETEEEEPIEEVEAPQPESNDDNLADTLCGEIDTVEGLINHLRNGGTVSNENRRRIVRIAGLWNDAFKLSQQAGDAS